MHNGQTGFGVVAWVVGVGLALCAEAQEVVSISFEEINAPCSFSEQTALRDFYEDQGVRFRGPAEKDGGGVLHRCANWSPPPRTGDNFLAFFNNARWQDGGVAVGPETMLFDPPVSALSVWLGAAFTDGLFLMEAFDASENLVDSNELVTRDWAQLSVEGTRIVRVVLTNQAQGPLRPWTMDDMEFTQAVACAKKTKLKAKCKTKRCGGQIKAVAKKAEPGSILVFRYDGANDKQANANQNGKAKVKWCPVDSGNHDVEIVGCDVGRQVACE